MQRGEAKSCESFETASHKCYAQSVWQIRKGTAFIRLKRTLIAREVPKVLDDSTTNDHQCQKQAGTKQAKLTDLPKIVQFALGEIREAFVSNIRYVFEAATNCENLSVANKNLFETGLSLHPSHRPKISSLRSSVTSKPQPGDVTHLIWHCCDSFNWHVCQIWRRHVDMTACQGYRFRFRFEARVIL